MTTTRSRSQTRRSTRRRRNQRRLSLPIVAGAALALAALVALAIALLGGDEATADDFDSDVATVNGVALPSYASAVDDPAVGAAAPLVEGRGLDGESVVAPVSGRPTILMFVAHWCPHCQAELPVVQDWVDAGGLGDDVDLVAVSTAVSSSRPNYPPSRWLEDEGWSQPTIADGSGAAADAYGLTAFPYFVVVDREGDVVGRVTGELTTAALDQLVSAATAER